MKLRSRTSWGSCSVFTVIVCRLLAIVKSYHQPIGHATPKVTWFGTEVGYSIVNLYADGDDWTDYHRATWTYLKRILRSARFFALPMRYIKSLRRFGKWTVFYIVLLCWLKGVYYRVLILDCVQNRPVRSPKPTSCLPSTIFHHHHHPVRNHSINAVLQASIPAEGGVALGWFYTATAWAVCQWHRPC